MDDRAAVTSRPINSILAGRWSPRAFSDRPVPQEYVISMLEAARWAPSSRNAQPWYFLVATRDQPTEHRRMVDCLKPRNQIWAVRAPVLLIALACNTDPGTGGENRYAWHDVGLATAQIIFEAESLGLRCHVMAGIDGLRIREQYGVPDGVDPVTAIAIGYQGDPADLPPGMAESEREPRHRRPLSETVFEGTWGSAHRATTG